MEKKKVSCHCSVRHINKNLTEVNKGTNNAHFCLTLVTNNAHSKLK